MNKKMLIPVIIAGVAIVIIVIIIIALSLSSSKETEPEVMDLSTTQTNNDVAGNSTENQVTDLLAELSEQEVSLYNTAISPYIGTGKTGVDVRSMIDAIIMSNQTNAGTAGKFISVDATAINAEIGKIGESAYSGNSIEYVDGCTSSMQNLKNSINAGSSYDIEATYSASGAITGVIIKEHSTETNTGNETGTETGLTPPATTAGRDELQTSLTTLFTTISENYQTANPGKTSRDLATYIKTDLENTNGTIKASLPANYIISNTVLSANTLTFNITIDTVVYRITFNAIDKTLTVE